MNWRDLKHEEPPENGAKYLVFIPSMGGGPPRILIARWINPPEEFDGMTFRWGGIGTELAHLITHWMPLPPPPDAEDEEDRRAGPAADESDGPFDATFDAIYED